MTKITLICSLLAGCWTTSQTAESKHPRETEVEVALAAVTLGDDCGDDAVMPPPVASAKPPVEAPTAVAPVDYRPHCDQTAMQLSLRASSGEAPTTVRVTKVELLDDAGRVLAQLASRAPTRWTTDGTYVAWDQTIAPNQTLAASYALAAPNWDALTNGRWNAHSKTFRLRVTMTIGSSARTVDKQSITPARLDPPVPT